MIPLLMCRASGKRVAFYASEVREVLLRPALRPSPLPAVAEGWLRLDRGYLPVVALGPLLGLEVLPPNQDDHLVLDNGETPVAWRVDRVEGLVKVDWDKLQALDLVSEGLAALVEMEPEPALLVSCPRLLLAREKELLERSRLELTAREEAANQWPPT